MKADSAQPTELKLKLAKKKRMTFIKANSVIASQPPEHRLTGTLHARAKSVFSAHVNVDKMISVFLFRVAETCFLGARTTAQATTAQADDCPGDNCPGRTTAQVGQLGRQLPQVDNCPCTTTAQV